MESTSGHTKRQDNLRDKEEEHETVGKAENTSLKRGIS